MRIMRLNFSHGSHEYHRSCVEALRNYLANRNGSHSLDFTTGITVNCAVAFDLKGPEIRTGLLAPGMDDLNIETGSKIVLTTDPSEAENVRPSASARPTSDREL